METLEKTFTKKDLEKERDEGYEFGFESGRLNVFEDLLKIKYATWSVHSVNNKEWSLGNKKLDHPLDLNVDKPLKIIYNYHWYEYDESTKKLESFNEDLYGRAKNNTIGEAGLVAISDTGEENMPGQLLSETVRKGHVRRFRKGYNTTHNAKITACAKLKQMVESDKIDIRSKNLVSELKNFVASGTSFAAKPGEHDDLVMSTLLILRMATTISSWDQKVFERLRDAESEITMPMPILISS